jgi:copper chaperone CopZ
MYTRHLSPEKNRSSGSGSNSSVFVPTPRDTRKDFIAIEGMTCSACTNTVEKCLLAQKGVIQAKVSLLLNRAEVLYYPDDISVDAMAEEVESVGFGARIINQNEQSTEANHSTATFQIADVSYIFNPQTYAAIMGIEGVINVHNDEDKIKIVYDSQSTGIRKIDSSLKELSIPCELCDSESDLRIKHKSLTEVQDLETEKWVSLLKIACIFTIPVFLITMVFSMVSDSKSWRIHLFQTSNFDRFYEIHDVQSIQELYSSRYCLVFF